MKQILYIFLFLSGTCFAQKPDSVVYSQTTKDTVVQTILKIVYNKETHYVFVNPSPVIPPDTNTLPIDTSKIWRGTYISKTNLVAGDVVKEAQCIADLKKGKFMHVDMYGVANTTAQANFNKRLRKEIPGIEIASTFSSISGAQSRCDYNMQRPDSSDFDRWNLESEPWVSSSGVTWATDEAIQSFMYANYKTCQCNNTGSYRGWPNANNFKVLGEKSTYILFHDYEKSPLLNPNYLKSRCDAQDAILTKDIPLRIIFSLEPAFMQGWIKSGHTLDEAYYIVKKWFDKQGYKHLKLDGYLVFHLDFWRASQPVMPSARMATPIKYNDPNFKNITSQSHLNMAEEPQ